MKKQLTAALAALTITATGPAAAGGIPVFDGVNLATAIQNTLYAIQQLQSLQQQYSKLEQQYEKIQQQYENMSGSYGMGNVFADLHTYGSQDWEDMLAILESGGNPGNAADVVAYGRQAAERFALDPQATISLAAPEVNNIHQHTATTAAAALAISRAAYNQTGERMARLESYLTRIDNATDMKAAQDLQNRLLVELTQAMLEANRLRAVMLQLQGGQAAARASSAQRQRLLVGPMTPSP